MIEMPKTLDLPAYTYRAPLEGVTYLWRFAWHDRPGAWYMDIFTDTESPIRLGIKLVVGWPLLRRLQHPNRPPGDLFVIGPDTALTFDSLCRTHRLYYLTQQDQIDFATDTPGALPVLGWEAA